MASRTWGTAVGRNVPAGHRDFKTTLIYADYQPSEHEAEFVARAFGDSTIAAVQPERDSRDNGLRGTNRGTNLSETQPT
jgi:hypothetical protein